MHVQCSTEFVLTCNAFGMLVMFYEVQGVGRQRRLYEENHTSRGLGS